MPSIVPISVLSRILPATPHNGVRPSYHPG
jgi:hypothetical protein